MRRPQVQVPRRQADGGVLDPADALQRVVERVVERVLVEGDKLSEVERARAVERALATMDERLREAAGAGTRGRPR